MSATDVDLETEAMEYALGLMDPEERRAFQADLLDDADLADAVWQAETMLAPLATALPERKPSAQVAKGVEQRLFGETGAAAVAKKAPAKRGPTRTGRAAWSGLATIFFTTTVASMFVIAVLIARPVTVPGPVQIVEVEVPADPVPVGPQLVAGLAAGGEVLLARVRDDGTIVVTALPATADSDHELWYVPDTGTPVSLGLVDTASEKVITVPPSLEGLIAAGATLSVTVEPAGGSPTGQPTGEVVASAAFQAI